MIKLVCAIFPWPKLWLNLLKRNRIFTNKTATYQILPGYYVSHTSKRIIFIFVALYIGEVRAFIRENATI